MELHLRIETGRRPGPLVLDGVRPSVDVVVRAEPSHTVRAVADAVIERLGLPVEPGTTVHHRVAAGGAGRAPASTDPIDDSLTVVEAGLVSGDGLVIGGRPEPAPAPGRGPRIVVASGPDAGRSVPLLWGAQTIGRDPSCHLALTDPQISRRHLAIAVAAPEGQEGGGPTIALEVLAPDRNPVRVDGAVVGESCPLRRHQVVRLGATTLVLRDGTQPRATGTDVFGQIPFHRTPYFPAPVRPVVVEPIADIPERPEPNRFAYLSALLPVVMGVSMALLLGSPRYLMFAAFSPIMVIGNWFDQRRRSGRDFAKAVDRFDEELAAKTAEVRLAIDDERARRLAAAPDLATLLDRARCRSPELWIRDRQAPDFLEVRVGVGDVGTEVDVRHNDRGDRTFRDRVVEAIGPTDIITDVPVTLPLGRLGSVGLVGHHQDTSAVVSSLVLQAACLHSPEDLVVVAAPAPARGLANWLKWLPHTRSASSPLAGPHLAGSTAEVDVLLAELVAEAGRRLEVAGSLPARPWLLVVLDRAIDPDATLVSRLLDVGPEVGISVLWLTDTAERVPRQAGVVIDCRAPSTGQPSRVTSTDPDVADHLVDLDRVSADRAARTARALAPLRDASSANAATAIPRIVPLFTALGVESVDTDRVLRWWKEDRGYSLSGPIGCTEIGPLVLDLVEHGPHGLIGGTSGAGKSELVMSLVAGLMAHNPPDRVNFLFIDYKGGASSDLFRPAPHTVGYVTNLDGLLATRALTSLRAELDRRMSLLQGRAKDLAEMIERYPDEAPPSLVIVVDEFATLVKEIPDFVTGMVDIAQRGRSLGIHLLLATQRPSGSVNDNIKANTNLRIALRMLDGGESSAVIGSPEAASIPTPLRGRGFAQMGSGELVAFQSAWSGAPLLAESGPPPVGVTLFDGRPVAAAPTPNPSSPGGHPRTQIDALLESVVAASAASGLERGRAPWLDVLPDAIPLSSVRAAAQPGPGAAAQPGLGPGPGSGSVASSAGRVGRRGEGWPVVIGMIDDPQSQSQYPAVVDLTGRGGLIVTGTGGSGKSTVLVTAAVSAALDDAEAGAGNLTIFALDFASRDLVGLRRLPQCGAVATGDDLEAVTRIIDRLDRELERRRAELAEAAARSEGPTGQSRILLLIDGMDALIQTMEQGSAAAGLAASYQTLIRLITEGRQVGLHPILAASRPNAIRASVASAISSRLLLRQAEAQSYADAGLSPAQAKDLNLHPGQGFLDGSTLVQVACLAGSEEAENRQRLVELAAGMTGRVDPRLVTAPLPRRVPLFPVPEGVDPLQPTVGLADLTGRPHPIDLRNADLAIVGDPRSGRSTALAVIGRQAVAAGAEVWAVGSAGSPLEGLDEVDRLCLDEGSARVEFLDELARWATEPAASDGRSRRRCRLLLLDDYDLLPESDRAVTGPLEAVLSSGAVRWVAAGVKPRGFSSSPVAQQVRSARSMVYLRPHDPREAHEVIGVPAPWHPGLAMVEGRGLVVVDRVATMVQFSDPFHRCGPGSTA